MALRGCWLSVAALLLASPSGCDDSPATPPVQRLQPDPTTEAGPTQRKPDSPALLSLATPGHAEAQLEAALLALGGMSEVSVLFIDAPGEGSTDGKRRLGRVEVTLLVAEGAEQHLPSGNRVKTFVARRLPGIVSDDVEVRVLHDHAHPAPIPTKRKHRH